MTENQEITGTYEDVMKKLQTIIGQIEHTEIPVDDLIAKVSEASDYITFLRAQIVSTEKKVDELVRSLMDES